MFQRPALRDNLKCIVERNIVFSKHDLLSCKWKQIIESWSKILLKASTAVNAARSSYYRRRWHKKVKIFYKTCTLFAFSFNKNTVFHAHARAGVSVTIDRSKLDLILFCRSSTGKNALWITSHSRMHSSHTLKISEISTSISYKAQFFQQRRRNGVFTTQESQSGSTSFPGLFP